MGEAGSRVTRLDAVVYVFGEFENETETAINSAAKPGGGATMGSILNESDRAEIARRMRSLSASSTRRWGSLDVVGMLNHLRLSASMALGELPIPSANKRAFQMFPLKHLILYVLPFPKGAPTAPELKPSDAASFEEERADLLKLLERIGTGPSKGAGPEHPLFGPLTWSEWGVVTYKHANHHLRQFGA